MSDISLAMNKIEEELKKTYPSKKKILNFLYDLQLYDFEFLNSIGETYKLNPLFFMNKLYSNIWKKMGKLLGKAGRTRAERYIVENFCLHVGEQILYECEGSIKKKGPLKAPSIKISVSLGVIFITNQRIIVHGKLTINELIKTKTLVDVSDDGLLLTGRDRHEENKKKKEFLYGTSEKCFGYMFPVKQLSNLKRSGRKISYELVDGKTTLTANKEQIDKLFDILYKF